MNSNKAIIKIVSLFAFTIIVCAFAFKVFFKDNVSGSGTLQKEDEMNSTIGNTISDYTENGMKGMWISYLEYQNINFNNADSFTNDVGEIFDNCKKMGLNTVIVHARAFGDAFYKSKYFPYSHIMTGVQGQDVGFDPLEIMVKLAHEKGLRIEAWVNPYRVKLNASTPAELSYDNPANDETLLISGQDGIYYNPALPRVRELVVNGIAEIVENYDVDGIHFDDYFYPSADLSVDENEYQSYLSVTEFTEAPTHEEWRRENVNQLIREIYARIKQIKPNVVFGISPQGNNYNNYNIQYSDVGLWMSETGYVDYIMPQLYWGNYYKLSNGSDKFAFGNILNEWATMPRCSAVNLYIGLGAYRVGYGDGGQNPQDEWTCGGNLSIMAQQIKDRQDVDGWALYRYDSLFRYNEYKELQQREIENLTVLNTK